MTTVTIKEEEINDNKACEGKCEVYSRVVGFYRPVKQWNPGKTEEFKDRKEYEIN